MIDSVEDIPTDIKENDCWEITFGDYAGKTICYNGMKRVEAGEINDR